MPPQPAAADSVASPGPSGPIVVPAPPVPSSAAAAPAVPPAASPPAHRPTEWTGTSFQDFLTDGSVAALCDEMARLARCPVWVRDSSGQVIVPAGGRELARGVRLLDQPPWSILDEARGRDRAFDLIGAAGREDDFRGSLEVPLAISTGTIGWLVAALPTALSTTERETIVAALRLLASSVCDVCEAQVALRKRLRELDALYQLSSILVEAKDPEETLRLALDLAIRVLGADAGSVSVFEDRSGGGEELAIMASRGLSDTWLRNLAPISYDGMLRQAALRGEVIAVHDLQSDARIADPERARAEGLVGLLAAGMIDQGRPIGLIRLYTRRPRVFTDSEGELLRAIAEHSATALSSARLRRLRQQDEFIQRQVKLAAAVQRRMLPKAPPNVPPFDAAAHYAPSLDLGGDFYDFMVLGGHLGIMIGDVVGKGVPAALLMSSVRAALRAHAQDVYDIEQVLSRTNRALVRDTLDNEFATCWYGVADPQTLRLTYCGAGHDWPMLVRVPKDRPVGEQDVTRLTADGMALGIDAHQQYPKGMITLAPGDCLVAYTDGVHDATNFEGKRFGGTRLRRAVLETLAAEPAAPAARVLENILWHIRQFTGLAGRADDLTLVVLRVQGR